MGEDGAMILIRAVELIELRDLKDRIVRLRDEAAAMSGKPVGFQNAARYADIARALTMLLEDDA